RLKQLQKKKETTKEKEVELIAMNKAEVEQLGLKVQFYSEKLKLRFIELLTLAVERRLQKSKERVEKRLNGRKH
ncbi:MAG TPA: hypothetical protein PKZ93_13360, partial [Spirochaetota bacterium]|nr:hypothetical protein [Spirochaetota bacterium]